MNRKQMEEKIRQARSFVKNHFEDDFESDQALKKPQPPLVKAPMAEHSLVLPRDFEKLDIHKSLTEIIMQRKSSRVFTQKKMDLLQLSYLLWATQGIKELRGKSYATLRTVASGGARHGFETYLVVRNVDGLQLGCYHYLPMEHELEYLHGLEKADQAITESLRGQAWAAKANVIFYWSLIPYRCEWRYSFEAHRVALIDAGHVGQNLYLACCGLQLGTCAIAAFDGSFCDKMFGLDGEEEFVVYTAPVGTIDSTDQDKEKSFYQFVEVEGL